MFRVLRARGVPVGLSLALAGACHVVNNAPSDGTAGSSNGGTSEPAGGGSSSSGKSAGGKSGAAAHGGRAGSAVMSEGGAEMGGAAGEGGASGLCAACPSGFCLDDGTCVDCLASDDHCPSGQYCTSANECVTGCKPSGDGCASGVCRSDHNCQSCIEDAECLAPLVCNDGVCSAGCSADQEGTSDGCDASLICCSQRCSDLATDSKNCGACGSACGSAQFCGNAGVCAGSGPCVQCHDTTIANVCAVSKVIVILDTSKNPSDGNRVPGRQIGAGLHDRCSGAPEVIEAEQDSVDALNVTSGRPVAGGGELLVVAGGPYYQNLEGYLESERLSPLYWYVDPAGSQFAEFRKSADDAVVLHLAVDGDHLSHDFFIIQFSRDKASGSLVLNAQGFWLSGTVAAAYQVTSGFLPDLSGLDKAWYAYEWTDADGDMAPDADEITLVDSGN